MRIPARTTDEKSAELPVGPPLGLWQATRRSDTPSGSPKWLGLSEDPALDPPRLLVEAGRSEAVPEDDVDHPEEADERVIRVVRGEATLDLSPKARFDLDPESFAGVHDLS